MGSPFLWPRLDRWSSLLDGFLNPASWQTPPLLRSSMRKSKQECKFSTFPASCCFPFNTDRWEKSVFVVKSKLHTWPSWKSIIIRVHTYVHARWLCLRDEPFKMMTFLDWSTVSVTAVPRDTRASSRTESLSNFFHITKVVNFHISPKLIDWTRRTTVGKCETMVGL